MEPSQTSTKPFFSLKDVSGCLETPLKERVKLLLLRLGKGQNWLADQVGINQGTMSKIVNGDWGASSQIKIRMAEVLQVDSLVLFGDSGYWRDYNKKINYGGGK